MFVFPLRLPIFLLAHLPLKVINVVFFVFTGRVADKKLRKLTFTGVLRMTVVKLLFTYLHICKKKYY